MMNNKKIFSMLVFLAGVFILAGCGLINKEEIMPAKDDSNIIFFYGDTCPHCKVVEEYFSKNQIAEKISFSQKEVYRNKANSFLLSKKAETCGIDKKSLGVPFLWADGECYMGDEDIINFFSAKGGSLPAGGK